MLGTSDWYAAKLASNGDALAIRNLSRQNYDVFCPRIGKSVRHARRTVRKLVPLFPGYLFVKIDIETQRWRPIDSTPGVAALVKFGDRPAPLPPGLVEAIQATAGSDGEILQLANNLEIDDEVRLVGGPFNDWIGRIVALPAPDRITLLIDIAARSVRLTVPAGSALPVEQTSPKRKRAA